MIIVPQKYEFEFKNYIKNKINLITNKITDDLIDNIFNVSDNKYLKIGFMSSF